MMVWVKEYLDILTKESLAMWIKKDIEIRAFEGVEKIAPFDIIIVSSRDDKIDGNLYNVVFFEETVDELSKQIINHVNSNFDYYFIKNALGIGGGDGYKTNTIVTGSSYGRLGVDENKMPNTVNLSLPSQDLYYSLKGIEHVCSHNSNIKNIVLCCSYYYFFSDMSRGKDKGILANIPRIYVPLFGEMGYHNCFRLCGSQNEELKNPIFDVNKIAEMYAYSECIKGYYNNGGRLRKLQAVRGWIHQELEWIDLSEEEKQFAAYKRASAHNKNLKREISYKENLIYLNELANFCNKRNINLLIVVCPGTKQYRMFLSDKFKEIFYDTLKSIDMELHLLDLFDNDVFCDEDFIDTDHLSDFGAAKLTKLINAVLIDI